VNLKYKLALLLFMLCLLSACSKQSEETPSEAITSPTPAPIVSLAIYDNDYLNKYIEDDSVNQVLLVNYIDSSNAEVNYYIKSEDNLSWEIIFTSDAFLGRNGIDKICEGDGKTPTGDFGIRKAFGIYENPRTNLEYIQIKNSTYACNENCEYYNQIIDVYDTGHFCSGEKMSAIYPEYYYGIETDYNPDNIYPNGSAIFIHCKGYKSSTGGCIALDEQDMKTLLVSADNTLRIIIN